MRVAVHKAIPKRHRREGRIHQLSELELIQPQTRQAVGIVELDAVDKIHRQDAPPAQIRMRLGHVHGRLVRKVTRAPLRVIRLAPKIELFSDGILKLGQQPVVRVAGE